MELNMRGNRLNKKSFMALFVSFCMVFALASSALAIPAAAKTVRIAVVTSISGDVTVKKGGGSSSYDAYQDMSLNEGDTLYTGSDSSATLNLSGGDGEVTIGGNAEVNISDLSGSSGEKKSKLRVWAGSMWVKVKSLAGVDDEFEVETPTAVMGVRGTHFFVNVDSLTGKTTMAVAAGKIAATTVTTNEDNTQTKKLTYLYPTQQISLDSRDEVDDLSVKVDFVNLDSIVAQASNNVIAAIIKDKASIDKENDEFIAKKKQEIEQGKPVENDGSFVIKNADELSRVIQNLDNLIGNFAKKAVQDNKVSKSEMNGIIEEANKKIPTEIRKLDLEKVKDLDKSAGTDPELEKKKLIALQQAEENQKLKEQQEAERMKELLQKLQDILKTVEATNKSIKEANEKALAEQKAAAEAAWKKDKTTEEIKRYDDAKNGSSGPSNSSGSSGSGGSSGGSSGGGQTPDTTPPVIESIDDVYANLTYISGKTEANATITVKRDGTKIAEGTAASNGYFYAYLLSGFTLSAGDIVSVTAADAAGNTSAPVTKEVKPPVASPPAVTLTKVSNPNVPSLFNVNVDMSNFTGTNSIYAVELHLLYKSKSVSTSGSEDYSGIHYISSGNSPVEHPAGTSIFNSATSAESAKEYVQFDSATNTYTKELVYAVTNFGTGPDNISVDGAKTLVSIPFRGVNYGSDPLGANNELAKIAVGYIKVVKKDATDAVRDISIQPLYIPIGTGRDYEFPR